jgi:hypothetical protein
MVRPNYYALNVEILARVGTTVVPVSIVNYISLKDTIDTLPSIKYFVKVALSGVVTVRFRRLKRYWQGREVQD